MNSSSDYYSPISRGARFMRALWGRAYVRVVGAWREPSWVITEVAVPILTMSAYVFIYRAIGAPKEYKTLVVVGGAMIPFWLTVLWAMAMQFYWEKEMGNLDLFLSSPMSPFALLGGMAVGGVFMAAFRVVFVVLFGVLAFDAPFELSRPLAAAAILLLTLSALFLLGAAASSAYFMVGRAGVKINMALMEPVFFLSGLYFPVKNMGFALGLIASAIPLTLGLDGVRQCTLPGGAAFGFLPVELEIAGLAAMTAIFGYLAARLLRAMERLGKRDGKATLKWE
jgi:ABC-2 type transport system permease protein